MSSASIVLVGDELLSGSRRDGNGVWLAEAFFARGVTLRGIETVPDEPERIAAAVRRAAGDAALVVVSGGLGPTVDDRTRDGIALAAGVDLVPDEGAWQAVVDCLARRGRTPPKGERRQGFVPAGGRWLRNAEGVAPGLDVQVGDARVVALPGVPREWRSMCREHVLADLAGDVSATQTVLWTAGVPEAEVADRVADLEALADVDVAFYPHEGEVELRFRATGADAAGRAQRACESARARLGGMTFDPPEGGRIQHAVVAQLRAAGLRLATAESLTGGLLARMVTEVPGASAVYRVGWVTYETAQKTERLGVPVRLIEEHGVVSAEVATAMAEGALARSGADVALATTGSAGPGPMEQEGHAPVPPGRFFVALARRGEASRAREFGLPFARVLVQRHAAVRALDLLRTTLAGGGESPVVG